MNVRRHGLAQRQYAVGGRVSVMAVAERLHRRLHHMFRRFEIRLADAEIDDVLPLPLKFGGSGENLKGCLGLEAGDGVCEDHSMGPFGVRRILPLRPPRQAWARASAIWSRP